MATRRPLVLVSGQRSELPSGDKLPSGIANSYLFPDAVQVPAVADFSWVNQGTATATDLSGSAGILLKMGAGSGDNLRMLVKSAPGTPYTITAWLTPMFGASANSAVGMCWRESGSGKIVTVGIAGARIVATGKLASPTSFNSVYTVDDIRLYGPVAMRLTDNGTNRIVEVSNDGVRWYTLHTVGRTDYLTANQVGIYVNPNAAADQASVALGHWAAT